MAEIFSYFFKYRPFLFREGDLSFLSPVPVWAVLLLFLGVAAFLFFVYGPGGKNKSNWFLWAVRCSFFLLLVALLMRPTLTVSTLVPRQTILPILVDNSKSMGIKEGMEVRGTPLLGLLEEDSEFTEALEENFLLRPIVFDSSARRFSGIEDLTFGGEQTNIRVALERALSETRNLPVGGVLLLTDGADNSYRESGETIAELVSRQIPIYTIGFGPETLETDVEIESVSTPREVLPESVTVARVAIRHDGFGCARGVLNVREGTTLVESVEVYLPRDNPTVIQEVKLFPENGGIREYEFEFVPLEGENISENNRRRTTILVRDTRPRILLTEGRPRWEYKFLRQALADDKTIRLEALLRTAINKFYRQGIEQEDTLAAGFPTRREDLFSYQGLILGDVESAFFSYSQMEMIRDFVGTRGGGLLTLGGGSTFGNGSYQNTPLEEVLPVWLENGGDAQAAGVDLMYLRDPSTVSRTPYGENHPALRLGRTADKDRELWSELPALTDRNVIRGLKPGATTLAEMTSVSSGPNSKASPLLVSHRYGRGVGLAFLSGSSWRWQMLRDHEDQTHETFWKQIMRWLVQGARDPVNVEVEREVYAQNEPVEIRVEVNDQSFNRINDSKVEATITSPSGTESLIPLQWNPQEEGVYSTTWYPSEDGIFRVTAEAVLTEPGSGNIKKRAETYFTTWTGQTEYFDPVQKTEYLRKLAEETGGRYYDFRDAMSLPEEIIYRESSSSVTRVLDLWDMPINFVLLLGFLFTEWITRRNRGLI